MVVDERDDVFKLGLVDATGREYELAEELVSDSVDGAFPLASSFLLDFRLIEKIGMINSNL